MIAIYGMCSPQLIDNYLIMTANPPKPPNTIKASVITTISADLVTEAVKDIKPLILQAEVRIQDTPNPAYRYTYYWSDVWKVWVKSRVVN